MEVFYVIVAAVLVIAAAFFLIVVIPCVFGRVFLRWSAARTRYVFSQSLSSIVAAVVGSLALTGLILLVGMVFRQQWAFSGGLLLVYTFWTAIKTVRENIRVSRRM
ncbi:MAG: hypothetical protein QM270_01850 [Bacillota bacterium]|nr:hypothetical protein [Bacillota bacterium]